MAMLLALTMILSVVPATLLTANAAVGDIYDDRETTGLTGDINTKDTISWPIKIYDYLNDGMLFEYSSAQDTSIWPHTGGSYGGAKPMPMIGKTIGEDYTSVAGYFTVSGGQYSGYTYPSAKHAFKYWGNKSMFTNDYDSNTTEVVRSINQPVDWVSPMSLHLTYDHSTSEKADSFTKSYGWVSNFARDDEQYYTGNQVRYMVLVYKTNDVYPAKGHVIRPYWAVSDSDYDTDYSSWGGYIDISDLTDYFGHSFNGDKSGMLIGKEVYVPQSTSWSYLVVDMKTNYADNTDIGIANNWTVDWDNDSTNELDLSTMERVAGVGMSYPLCGTGEEMDISHIAYFSSEEEAKNFGDMAVEFDNEPGEYIGYTMSMTHKTDGAAQPVAPNPSISGNGWDFTASGNAAWSDYPYSYWNDPSGGSTTWMSTTKKTDSKGFTYTRVGSYDYATPDYLPFYSSSGATKSSIDHIVLVYKTSGISGSPTMGFGITDYSNYAGWGSASYSYQLATPASSSWRYIVYPLENIPSSSSITTIKEIRWWLPGLTTSQYFDLAFVDYFADAASAEAFGQAALNYLNHYGETVASDGTSVVTTVSRSSSVEATYNMGSNQAFTMLYANSGGGWAADSTAGGTNSKNNGYFNYQIGYAYMLQNSSSQTNDDRETARDDYGYPVSDSIFLLNTYSSNSSSLAGVDLSYDSEGNLIKRFDMSKLELGYTLYNTMKDSGVMTAGLLQSGMATYKGMDGEEYRIMQYKDDTMSYIALLLQKSLCIPSRDANGYNYNYVKGTRSPLFYEDWDGDGRLDTVDEDLDKDGHLDIDEYQGGAGNLYSEDFDRDGHLDVYEDNNGNGKLDYSEDLDGDGRLDPWEDLDYDGLIDPGEDVDGDGKLDVGEDVDYDGNLDVWEDINYNGVLDDGEDIDGDGHLDIDEDLNGNNELDWITEDRNYNGVLDEGEDLNGNGKLDRGEDLNGNGRLDLGEDKDGDGKLDCGEDKNYNGQLDEGEDLNGNGTLDLYEDLNENGILDLSDDMDGDGKLDTANEDVDGDGHLDINEKEKLGDHDDVLDGIDLASALRSRLGIVFTDTNWTATTATNAQKQPNKAPLGSYAETSKKFKGEDANNNGKLDAGEDLNGNGRLDKDVNLLIGPYLKCAPCIETFYDAAYYLLHNIFVPGSYNHVENDYNYLVMSKGYVTSEDKYAYVFDAGFTYNDGTSATVYDDVQKTISQAVAEKKHHIVYVGDNTTTLHPFLPINDSNDVAGAAGSEFKPNRTPYVREDGAVSATVGGATYSNRNYNYVMTANGEFVFHRGDNLFFDFEGDDDVYMFVNGELVLDIGAAHSITKVGFNMNDYVDAAEEALEFLVPYGYRPAMSDEAFLEMFTAQKLTQYTFDAEGNVTSSKQVTNPFLGDYSDDEIRDFLRMHRLHLVDGNSYNIDFYYMERHGWGANMRIATNIVMTDPSVVTDKTAYQGTDANGQPQEIEYGGLIDDSQPVNYSFAMTNKGNTKLYKLSFADENIGVDISAANGLQVFGKATTTKFTVTEQTTLSIEGLNGIFDLNGTNYNVRADGTISWTEDGTTHTSHALTLPYNASDSSKNEYVLTLYQYENSKLFNDVDVKITLGAGTSHYAPKQDENDDAYMLQLGSINTVKVLGVRVADGKGGLLDPSDLIITVDGYASPEDYAAYAEAYEAYQEAKEADPTIGDFVDKWRMKTIRISVKDNAELKQFLTNLQDPRNQTGTGEGVPEGKSALYYGAGLWQNATVTISGMWYTLSEEEQADKIFNNTVYTKAYKSMNSDDPAKGQASHRVYSPGEPMYFQWANQPVFLDVDRFWTDVVAASNSADNTMNEQLEGINKLNKYKDSLVLEIVDRNGGQVSVVNNYYNAGKWTTLPGSERTAPEGFRTIYYKQVNDWKDEDGNEQVYVYYWSDTDKEMSTWPGKKMSFTKKGDDGKDIYQFDIPSNARYVIFNNGSGTQTEDISVPIVDYDKVHYDSTNKVLHINYDSPGMHMFYVKVTSSKTTSTAMVPVTFYVTYMEDKSIVLDYGLATENLNTDGQLFARDELLGSHNTTSVALMGITTQKPSYNYTYSADAAKKDNLNRILFQSENGAAASDGTVYYDVGDGKYHVTANVPADGELVSYNNGKYAMGCGIWFTPEKFMDQEYDLWLAFSVHNKDAVKPSGTAADGQSQYHAVAPADKGTIDIGTEVQMYKKVTVVPATVVYYEDDFADVTYTAPEGSFERHGAGSGTLTQGIGQDVPYGQDSTYQHGMNAEISGDSMTTINIADSNDVAKFTFTGTGFELIGRTNAFDSATILVTVMQGNELVYRLPVITEFTSSITGCDHAYHNTNGYCTYCAKSVSHNYVNNVCSVCGARAVDYYLMGYINNYDHDQNSTQYKFVDGKLTTTFDSESYVVVHDSNGKQYWTNGYPGNATSTILYDLNSFTEEQKNNKQNDKLRIPGGVEVTLTLMDNGDGTMALSYAYDPVFHGDRTVYFVKGDYDWEEIYIYYWSDSNTGLSTWPGVPMESVEGKDGYYSYKLPSEAEYVIFNKGTGGDGNQTSDQTIPGDNYVFKNGKWYVYGEENNVVIPTTQTVYFVKPADWDAAYAHYWTGSNSTSWPGVEMTFVRDNIYSVEISSDYQNIIFNNNAGTQTGDMVIPGDGQCYDFASDTWSEYVAEAPTTKTVYYDNRINNWSGTMYAYWWGVDGAPSWPGMEMTHVEGTVYSIEVPIDTVNMIFNNNSGSQTGDLTIPGDGYVYDNGWSKLGEVTYKTVYFKNTNGWTTPAVHYWSDIHTAMTQWPGTVMTHVEGDIYSAQVRSDAQYIIFNNNNNGSQTDNLTLNFDTPCYAGGSWYTYPMPDLTRPVYFDNTGNWDNVKVYYWSDSNKNMIAWPGVDMTYVSGSTYTANIPLDAKYVMFNNGTATGMLSLGSGDLYSNGAWSSYLSGNGRVMYFKNTENWAVPTVYAYTTDGKIIAQTMSKATNGMFSFRLPANTKNIAFADGALEVSAIPAGKDMYSLGRGWYASDIELAAAANGMKNIVFFDGGKWGSAVAAWSDGSQTGLVQMTAVAGKPGYYTCQVPTGASEISFAKAAMDVMEAPEGLNLVYNKGYFLGEWTTLSNKIVYYKNTTGMAQPYVYYWTGSNTDPCTGAGEKMVHLEGNIWYYELPANAQNVMFNDGGITNKSNVPEGEDLYSDGQWITYVSADNKQIHQVPVIRVTDLEHGTYTVYISGIPTYRDDTDWNRMADLMVKVQAGQTAQQEINTFASLSEKVNELNGKAAEAESKLSAFESSNSGPKWSDVHALLNAGKSLDAIKAEFAAIDWDAYVQLWNNAKDLRSEADRVADLPNVVQAGKQAAEELAKYQTESLKETYLYIDGIRIYQPMTSTNSHYSDKENGASFVELRDLVLEGKASVATYDVGTTVYNGNLSWSENRNGWMPNATGSTTAFTSNQVGGINDYMVVGPNNELYLNGNLKKEAIILQVKEDPTVRDRTLQIAARAINDGLFLNGQKSPVEATLYQSVLITRPDGTTSYGWSAIDIIESGTEQYYVIDYTRCPYDAATGTYQVALYVRNGMVSLTNVKYKGLTFPETKMGNATVLYYNEFGQLIYPEYTLNCTVGGQMNTVEFSADGSATVKFDKDATIYASRKARGTTVPFYANGNVSLSSNSARLSDAAGNSGVITVPANTEVTFYIYDNGNGTLDVLWSTDGQMEASAASEAPDLNMASVSLMMSSETFIGEIVPMPEETVQNPTLSMNSASLSFDDEIRYNIYFNATDLDDVVEMGLITFADRLENGTMADALDVIPGVVTDGSEYMAHTNGIPAKNMGDTVYFKVYAKLSDGSYVYSDVAGYNAVRYAEYILANSKSQSMKALVVSMLNYGAEAQKYFGYKTDALMNAGLTAADQALVNSYDESMVATLVAADSSKTGAFTKSEGFGKMSTSVSFDGAFSINYYLTAGKAVEGDVTFYFWTAADYAKASELTAENATGSVVMTSGSEYWASVREIAAKQIDETVYVAAVYTADGETQCSGVLAYSLGQYCKIKAADEASAVKDFAAATAVYGFYAKNYFAN